MAANRTIPFHQLSRLSKLKRLHGLAVKALEAYPIRVRSIRCHGFETNLLYRVTDTTGRRYILRLATPGWRTIDNLRAEAFWLEALSVDTAIPVPAVIKNSKGMSVAPVATEGIPTAWNVTLFTWLPGQLLGRHLTEKNLERMGDLFARLHAHAGEWTPPAAFPDMVFDRYLSRGEEETFLDTAFLAKERGMELNYEQHEYLSAVRNRVNDAYRILDKSDIRVIHCDLWHDNIKLHRGVLAPFDFEDTILGYRLHDIAMAMLDLLEDTDVTRYRALYASFRNGYEKRLIWPEGNMELLQIGRLLWQLNWNARHRAEDLPSVYARYLRIFRDHDSSGAISL